MVVKSPAQKFLCTCDIYHQVLDESVCDATKQVLQEMKDGEPEKKSTPEGNKPKDNETEGIQHKKSERLKEKEENWENNNKFMILKKETGQKWANISRVCSSNVEDYVVNQPEVDFSNLKYKNKRSHIVSPVSWKSTSTEGFN